MITNYGINIPILKDVRLESLLTSFGKTSSQPVIITIGKDGTRRIKNIWLDSDDVTEESTAQMQAQAIYDAHDSAEVLVNEQKAAQVTEIYNAMNTEVYTAMGGVFGTTNADSATAYERTWEMMKAAPENWSGAGLLAEFAVGGFAVGDALDTDQKVTDYATAKIAEVLAYGVWRMQRIKQFKIDRAAILAS